jgi:SSS family solute:Na+ symporter
MAVYIFVIILVGVLMGRKSKKGSDYFLGGRSIGPWVTAFSFIAAYFSSVLIIGGGGFGYKFGLGTLWIGAINVLVGCFMAWMVLGRRVRRMTQKLDTMTIPEFFAERFGSQAARIFAAAIIMIFLIVYNVSVLKGMGNAFEVLMGWPYTLSVLISGIIILLYVAIGGYLAVVWTSFIQAWVMIFGLIFLTVFALIEVGGLTQLNLSLSAIDPGLIKTPGVWGWAGLISFSLIVSFGVWGMPQLIVRFYSIKKARLIKLGAVLATVGGTVALLPYLNGAIARVLYPGLESADLAIPTLTKGVLPAWAGGLLLAGVIAAGMSTFAAVLIIVSSSVVRDVMQKGMKIKFTEKQLANGGRIVCVVAGLVSLLIALKPPDLVLVITGFSWAVIASTNLWPILFGIYWKRASKLGVLASMISGAATALVWQVLTKVGWSPVVSSGIHGFIPGMIVGLVVIIVVSLLTKKPDPRRIKRAFGP